MVLGKFDKVSLEDLKGVSLMKSVDQKFILPKGRLDQLLDSISNHYYSMLEIDNKSNMHYQTAYFDTSKDDMYKAHHNGKLNRFKIRYQNYSDTDTGFLELKFKNNKGRTTKSRIPSTSFSGDFTCRESNFIDINTPYSTENLTIKLKNQFSDPTVVSNVCTISIVHLFSKSQKSSKLICE